MSVIYSTKSKSKRKIRSFAHVHMHQCLKTPPMYIVTMGAGFRSVEGLPFAGALPNVAGLQVVVARYYVVQALAGVVAGSKPPPAYAPLHLGVVGIDPERGAVVAGIASTPEAPNGEGLEHSFAGLE
jgi:hypothetical protein